jgi:hypothetical protein
MNMALAVSSARSEGPGGGREGEGPLGLASPLGLVDGEARDSSSNLLQRRL